MQVMVFAVLVASALAACGQRGSLYIPGKPGDPYYDRKNSGATPNPANAPNSIKPGATPAAPTAPTTPKRDDEPAS